MDDDLKNFPYEQFPYGGVIKEVPVWEMVVKSVIYGIITISSLFGNVLIIVIVMKNKTMKTVTNYYIVNLAVADLMVTLTCTWVTLVDNLTEGWILGAFFCKLNTFTKGNFTNVDIPFGFFFIEQTAMQNISIMTTELTLMLWNASVFNENNFSQIMTDPCKPQS